MWRPDKRRLQRGNVPTTSTGRTPKDLKQENDIMWNPFWLRKMWLGAYAILFGMLAVATLALYLISNGRHGLGVFKNTTEMVYFWKFGPTAILVAVLALWNPVDYFTRLLQPWVNLSKGPAPASRTLLLDYVSPIQPTIVYLAVRHREWPVLVTSVVAIVLTVIKVLSTGLLVIQITDITVDNVTLIGTAVFDASYWNTSNPLAGESVSLYNGIERENLTRPSWTGSTFAVEPFNLTDDEASLANATYNGVTRGIYPGLECDQASFKQEPIYFNETSWIQRANVTYSTDTCEAQVTLMLGDPTQAYNRQNRWAAENYIGDVIVIQCSEQERFLIHVTQADRSLKVTDYSALICRPFYRIQNVTVYVDESGKQQYEHLQSADSSIGRIDNLDPKTAFAVIVNASLRATLPWVQPSGDITEANFPFLTLAAIPFTRSKPGSSYLKPLLDVSNLQTSVTAVFAGVLSLLVSQQMLQPAVGHISGNLRYVEDRLQAQKTPSIVITVLLLLCLSLTAMLIIILPTKVTPTNPNSISGMATILGRTLEMRKFGNISLRNAEQNICDRNFKSVVAVLEPSTQEIPTFNIVSSAVAESKASDKRKTFKERNKNKSMETAESKHERKTKNWCPYTLRVWVKASSLALCLAIIAALELLQQKSDRSNGLVAITSRDSGQFWATVVPAAVLTGLALLYSSIYFNTALLAPYHHLTKKLGAAAKCSLASDYLGNTPLFTIPMAVRRQHIATCASAFAAVAAAFLTIIVSGLYTVQSHSFVITTTVQRYDSWNVTWPLTESDASAAQGLQFITWRNLSEPQWSYDDLAIPIVLLPAHPVDSADQDKLTITVPVRQAALECAATKPADNVASIGLDNSGGSTFVYSSVTNTCSGRPGKELPLRSSVLRSLAPYGGYVQQLFFDPRGKSARALSYPDADHPFANPDNSSCPSLVMVFGSFPVSDVILKGNESFSSPPQNFTSPTANVTVLACMQILYEVDAKVTFLLPQLSIDLSNPPVVDEASKRRVGGTYQFPIVAPLGSTLDVLSSNTTFNNDVINRLGSFFAAVVHGKDGIPAHELAGEENIPRLIEAASKMYGRYMALVMSRKMRSSEQPDMALQSIPAAISQREDRLVQHRGAKIGLQVLLAVMTFCGVVSWATMWKVRILPHSPSSIVGVACLLRGRAFWGASRQKLWTGDQIFALRPGYDGRVGIYAASEEIKPLVDSRLVPKSGVNKKAATF